PDVTTANCTPSYHRASRRLAANLQTFREGRISVTVGSVWDHGYQEVSLLGIVALVWFLADIFPNVPIEDRKLYETGSGYHNGDLTYTFDIAKDGEYVIVLKFSEVYFQSSGQKVRIYRTFLIHEARNMKADNTYM
ncbi:hypothetical protein OSTOST_19945, partial [Ostertagia ostertagi]